MRWRYVHYFLTVGHKSRVWWRSWFLLRVAFGMVTLGELEERGLLRRDPLGSLADHANGCMAVVLPPMESAD